MVCLDPRATAPSRCPRSLMAFLRVSPLFPLDVRKEESARSLLNDKREVQAQRQRYEQYSVVVEEVGGAGEEPTRLLCHWNSPLKNTGVGSYSPLQGIFSTQGSNPHLPSLPHCKKILYHLSHQGSPILNSKRCGHSFAYSKIIFGAPWLLAEFLFSLK